MKTHEDTGDNIKTSNDWNELKDVKYAGENIEENKPTFNEKYINDFGRDKLREMLGDKEALKTIGDDYLSQYKQNSQSKAINLAKKESLDHFVLERLSSEHPEMFIESQEFKNYTEYILKTANSKHFNSTDNRYTVYPEFVTNPVLRNKKARELVLKTAIPDGDPEKMDAWVKQNYEWYKGEVLGSVKKMEEREQISQRDFEIIGDYLYSSKRFGTNTAKVFAEYCFNEIKPDYKLKPTTPVLGALANYFASQYAIDDDVKKNSRFFIANSNQEPDDLKIGVSTVFGCVLEQKHFAEMSLITDNSLNKSRTNLDENNDIYRLMMVSFHELTHDHQKNLAKKGDKSGSAMMYIMRDILNKGSGCYVGKKKDGSEIKGSYYKANHDNDEIEIEADEEAWRQCRTFLVRHQKVYEWNHPNKELQEKFSERYIKCKKNEEEVRARRTFTKKLANTKEQISATKYDVETLQKTISDNPAILKIYPQLADYVDKDGNLRPNIFVNSIIAKRESSNGNFDSRDDVFGTEIGTYMLTDQQEATKLAGFIRDNGERLTTNQAKILISNLYNIVHQTVEKNRALKGINFDNYDETHAHGKGFDLTEKKTAILQQYLIQAYNSIWSAEIIKQSHPELSERIDKEEGIYIGGYYQELSRDTALDINFIRKTISNYEKTKNPTLIRIAMQLRNDYGL